MAVSYGRHRRKPLDGPISSVLFYDRLHVCLASKSRARILISILLSDVISFSAIFVWCGFQTGNFAQVRGIL